EQGRAGKGSKVMQLTDKTGPLAAMLMVELQDELMIITDDCTIIRTRVEDIRQTGRVTQGVRMMRVAEGSRIVDVDIAAHVEELEEEYEELEDLEAIEKEIVEEADLMPEDDAEDEDVSLDFDPEDEDSEPEEDNPEEDI
ncbi:MAG: DNA gyrase subunit A, partial [Clostridiales bacterium]|nr:DNA gyrase subunit A [Clostridiales bacterium]